MSVPHTPPVYSYSPGPLLPLLVFPGSSSDSVTVSLQDLEQGWALSSRMKGGGAIGPTQQSYPVGECRADSGPGRPGPGAQMGMVCDPSGSWDEMGTPASTLWPVLVPLLGLERGGMWAWVGTHPYP